MSERQGAEQDARILIGLLAFNESASIEGTVRELQRLYPALTVAVVDDGSSDDTSAIARRAGALVLRHPVNVGIAAAEATLFKYALRHGYDVVVRMDGDGQHDPRSLPTLLDALRGGADLVVGSRFVGARTFESTGLRRAGISVLARLLTALTGHRVTDPTSGYRAFSRRALELFSQTMLHDYPEPESVLLARRRGLVVQEVPASMRARTAGQSSITPLRAMFYMLKVCFALSLELLRPR